MTRRSEPWPDSPACASCFPPTWRKPATATRWPAQAWRLQLGRNLALPGSYTLTDAEYVRAAAGQQGKTPYQVPRQMASVWTDYTVLGGVSVGAGVRHVGSSWADNDNTLKVPAYTLADLALRIDLALFGNDWRGANLRFNVKNVADKTYVASCASLG